MSRSGDETNFPCQELYKFSETPSFTHSVFFGASFFCLEYLNYPEHRPACLSIRPQKPPSRLAGKNSLESLGTKNQVSEGSTFC